MPKKEMTVKEYERMTKTPYQSKFNKADYGPEALSKFDTKEFTYTGEGASNKAGAGRGFVNPQRTDEPDESYVSPKARYDAEKASAERKDSDAAEKAYMKASKDMGMKAGGKVSSASSRADGCATKGKTRGKYL